MKFQDIPYERVDLAAWQSDLEELTRLFREAPDFAAAEAIFLRKEELDRQPSTMITLASIRHDIDTRDEFYDAERNFYDEQLPTLEPAMQEWTKAMLESPFRPDFAAKYGNTPFLNAELELRSFTPEIIEELQQENALVSQYMKLIASAQIPFEGNTYTVSQMTPFKLDPDDDRRKAAWIAEGSWYAEQVPELDRIYDELVTLRDRMGKKLGHSGYTPLGYDRMQRNCYGPEQVEAFRVAVQKYVVPLAKKLYQRQAQRQGRDFPLSFADVNLSFRSGNPKPQGTPDEILDMGNKLYAELHPETDAFWKALRENDMLDVLSKPGKAGGGYCTELASARSPFIFANFNGTAHDVEVVTHEAGHAFAWYLNRDRVPASTSWPSMEGCEVHSMSMEFFASGWADGFFGPDARKFRYTQLEDALTFIPYGTMVDHFQHIMYEYPEFSPEERHQCWQELLGLYMPWVKPGEIPFYGDGKGWQRQNHIYTSPFYYIDYCLAQTVALEFWAKIQENLPAAFETYLRYARLGGSLVFTDLLKEAGLESPFDENTLRSVCEKADRWLAEYDLTGIE